MIENKIDKDETGEICRSRKVIMCFIRNGFQKILYITDWPRNGHPPITAATDGSKYIANSSFSSRAQNGV